MPVATKLYVLQAFGGIICPWSRKTSQTVDLCPKSREEMEVRAKKKNCGSIAHEQKCTGPKRIKYHCVMNELETAFIEVCAPVYRIHGTILGLNKKKIQSYKFLQVLSIVCVIFIPMLSSIFIFSPWLSDVFY